MVKKGIILLLLAFSLPLFGGVIYESNAISQPIVEKPELSNIGYELVIENNRETLFLDGKTIQEKVIDKNKVTVEFSDYMETYLYDDNRVLQSFEKNEKDNLIKRDYYYDDNTLLKQVVESRNGTVESIINYQRDYNDVVIASTIIEFGNYYQNYYNSKSLVATTDEEILVTTFIGDNLYNRDVYTREGEEIKVNDVTFSLGETEEIHITTREGDKKSEQVFLPSGQITKESVVVNEEIVSETVYNYTEDVKTSTISREGNKEIEAFFENQIKVKEIEKINGKVQAIREYNEDGTMIEIAHRDGKEFAKIYYDVDKQTVLRIEIL